MKKDASAFLHGHVYAHNIYIRGTRDDSRFDAFRRLADDTVPEERSRGDAQQHVPMVSRAFASCL